MTIKQACLLLVLVFCILGAQGRVERFWGRSLDQGTSLENQYVFLLADDSYIGSTHPQITLNQEFTVKKVPLQPGSITLLFYQSTESSKIGIVDDNGLLQLCCTVDLMSKGKCTQAGSVIFTGDTSKIRTVSMEFNPTTVKQSVNITENEWRISASGVYSLKYINCEDSGLGTVKIDGQVRYINPFGQLSAESYPLLWFFGLMFSVLIVVIFSWLVSCGIWRTHLDSLHYFLTAVLILEIVECGFWFFFLWVTNSTGYISVLWLTLTVLFSSMKRTSVGLLILLISLGYGIMNKAKIGTNRRLIILSIGFYFAVSCGQELVTAYIKEGVVSSDVEILLGFISLILLFPSVMIPLGLFWWICTCLLKTIQKLKIRNQEAKLSFYSKLFVGLITAAIITSLMIVLQTTISIVNSEEIWRVWWFFTAYWFILFFGLTLMLLFFLHPSRDPNRFAYAKTKGLAKDEFDISLDTELTEIPSEPDLNIDFEFDLGLDDIMEEETSKNA